MAFLVTAALLIIPYVVALALISGLGIGAGYLLRWLLGIDLESAIISGMIVASASAYFAMRIYSLIIPTIDDETFSEDGDETPVIYVSDLPRGRGRRKRK